MHTAFLGDLSRIIIRQIGATMRAALLRKVARKAQKDVGSTPHPEPLVRAVRPAGIGKSSFHAQADDLDTMFSDIARSRDAYRPTGLASS